MSNTEQLEELIRTLSENDMNDFETHWNVTEKLIGIVYSQQYELELMRKVKKKNS